MMFIVLKNGEWRVFVTKSTLMLLSVVTIAHKILIFLGSNYNKDSSCFFISTPHHDDDDDDDNVNDGCDQTNSCGSPEDKPQIK